MLSPVERQLVCNAVNILMWKGQLDGRFSYEFVVDAKGRDRVRLWIADARDPRAALYGWDLLANPRDLISDAGPLALVQGKSDNL